VDSEFAQVKVTVDTSANGPRLRLEDLTQLPDPSADRWRDA
jgi:hypothetical protein